MTITATELKASLGKYLSLAATKDIFITQYAKVVAKLTNPFQGRLAMAESLFGSVPDTLTPEEAQAERRSKL